MAEAIDSKSRKLLTLCIVTKGSQILLGLKKIRFGAGKWNGFGGKVEEGEAIEDAAKRELLEESGLTPHSVEKRAVISFDFEDGSKSLEVHVFACSDFEGEPVESDEMRPQWFELNNIPLKDMWTADAIWLPMFLEGKKFRASFVYDRPSSPEITSVILKQEIREMAQL